MLLSYHQRATDNARRCSRPRSAANDEALQTQPGNGNERQPDPATRYTVSSGGRVRGGGPQTRRVQHWSADALSPWQRRRSIRSRYTRLRDPTAVSRQNPTVMCFFAFSTTPGILTNRALSFQRNCHKNGILYVWSAVYAICTMIMSRVRGAHCARFNRCVATLARIILSSAITSKRRHSVSGSNSMLQPSHYNIIIT